MKKVWFIVKRILTITGVMLCAALFVVVLTSAVKKQGQLTCRGLKVKIDYESGLAFLNEAEIAERINSLYGGSITKKPMASINFKLLENELKKNPFVERAEVYVDQQQNMHALVWQKRPILRILNSDGVGFYISEKNKRIPLCDKFTPHVPVALGNVETHRSVERDSVVQMALFNLIQYVRQDEFLSALVDQIYVNENGEFDLIPRTGEHIIRIGKANEEMEVKFSRLKVFYKEGLNKTGWTKYKVIDLRYRNQVVCEKKDTVITNS